LITVEATPGKEPGKEIVIKKPEKEKRWISNKICMNFHVKDNL